MLNRLFNSAWIALVSAIMLTIPGVIYNVWFVKLWAMVGWTLFLVQVLTEKEPFRIRKKKD